MKLQPYRSHRFLRQPKFWKVFSHRKFRRLNKAAIHHGNEPPTKVSVHD